MMVRCNIRCNTTNFGSRQVTNHLAIDYKTFIELTLRSYNRKMHDTPGKHSFIHTSTIGGQNIRKHKVNIRGT